MADRWSNPSGSKGFQRFRVWPSGQDSYDHVEFQENWDALDDIIGGPPAAPFTVTIASPAVFTRASHGLAVNDAVRFFTTGALPTGLTEGSVYYVISAGFTTGAFQVSAAEGGAAVNTSGAQSGTHNIGTWPETEGIGGGIYAEVAVAKAAAVPVGSVFPFFRPTADLDLPDGYEICDGREVADHDFLNVSGPVTLPDMRNRAVLGASEAADPADAETAITDANINNYLGAPAVGQAGGLNSVTLTKENLYPHKHTGSLTGWARAMETWYNDTVPGDGNAHYPAAGNFEVHRWGDSSSIGVGDGGYQFGQHRHKLNNLATAGRSKPHENRPRSVGLVWIMKCREAV